MGLYKTLAEIDEERGACVASAPRYTTPITLKGGRSVLSIPDNVSVGSHCAPLPGGTPSVTCVGYATPSAKPINRQEFNTPDFFEGVLESWSDKITEEEDLKMRKFITVISVVFLAIFVFLFVIKG